MSNTFKRLFGKKTKRREFSEEESLRHDELKQRGLELVLGEMHNLVSHALIPFAVGGAVDIYRFPNAMEGTGFATMELIELDGSGPLPSRIGTYELVGFTRHDVDHPPPNEAFEAIENRLGGLFSMIGHYSYQAVLNPGDTMEAPLGEDEPNPCVILDEYRKPGTAFKIGPREHGLLLVIEVFRSEMDYARAHGTSAVLEKLKMKGHYPYSDLDREPVV